MFPLCSPFEINRVPAERYLQRMPPLTVVDAWHMCYYYTVCVTDYSVLDVKPPRP